MVPGEQRRGADVRRGRVADQASGGPTAQRQRRGRSGPHLGHAARAQAGSRVVRGRRGISQDRQRRQLLHGVSSAHAGRLHRVKGTVGCHQMLSSFYYPFY